MKRPLVVLAAGYVLLKEEDRWLRAVAAKAILIVCIFGVIGAGITMVENGISGLNYLVMFIGAGLWIVWQCRIFAVSLTIFA